MKKKTIQALLLSACLAFSFAPVLHISAAESTESVESKDDMGEERENAAEAEETSFEEPVDKELLIQSQEPIISAEDEHPVVESINTFYSDETSGMICLTAIVPENFGLTVYAQIENVDTGVVYNLPMYAENGYFERCYVPEGNYIFQIVSVYGDNKNTYSFDFPENQFYVQAKQSAEYELNLSNFDEVDLQIQEKRGISKNKEIHVETNYVVDFEGTGSGELGVTGETYGEYFIQVKITKSGSLGDAMFSYSEDGGNTWSESETIPLSGYYRFGDWQELTAEFFVPEEAETAFVEGDTFSFFVQDPNTTIVVSQESHSQAWATIISTTPDMRAFEVLEASGMHIKVKIVKGGRFDTAVWQISTDGGLTWGEEEYAKEETAFHIDGTERQPALDFILKFEDYTENEATNMFMKDDVFDIYAERTVDNTALFGMLALILLLGGAGAAAFAGYKYLKKQIPSEDSYRIKK